MKRFFVILLFLVLLAGCGIQPGTPQADVNNDVAGQDTKLNNDTDTCAAGQSSEDLSLTDSAIPENREKQPDATDPSDDSEMINGMPVPILPKEDTGYDISTVRIDEGLREIIQYAESHGYGKGMTEYLKEDDIQWYISFSENCETIEDMNYTLSLFSSADHGKTDKECVGKIMSYYDDGLYEPVILLNALYRERPDMLTFHEESIIPSLTDGYYETQYEGNIIRFFNWHFFRDGVKYQNIGIMVTYPDTEYDASYLNGAEKVWAEVWEGSYQGVPTSRSDCFDKVSLADFANIIGKNIIDLELYDTFVTGYAVSGTDDMISCVHNNVPVDLRVDDEMNVWAVFIPTEVLMSDQEPWDLNRIRTSVDGEISIKRESFFKALGPVLTYQFFLEDYIVVVSADDNAVIFPDGMSCIYAN